MLNKFALSLAIGVATLGAAVAQQAPATPIAPSNPAVSTPSTPSASTPSAPSTPTAVAPLPGANSFTEAQAKTAKIYGDYWSVHPVYTNYIH